MVGAIKMKSVHVDKLRFSTMITTETNDDQNRKYIALRGLAISLLRVVVRKLVNLSGKINTDVFSQRTCYPNN